MASLSLPLMPHLFLAATVALAVQIDWPRRWILSGAPILTYSLLLGAVTKYRVLPSVPLWTLVATLNLAYAVAATSWLLYWVFLVACYPAIFIACCFQFNAVADLVRGRLRSFIRHLHFVDDKVAFFNLPALDIDTEVDGLMVIRGVTCSISTLTIIVHGVEVGLKLSKDVELSLRTDDITISLLHKIDIGDVYFNYKGGMEEKTFGGLKEEANDVYQDARASTYSSPSQEGDLTDKMSDGTKTKQASAKDGLKSAVVLNLSDQQALEKYQDSLRRIRETDPIRECHLATKQARGSSQGTKQDAENESHQHDDILADVCSRLQDMPSVSQTPERSIKVTTLQELLPIALRGFLNRLPMIYRFLISILSYFHPINVASITVSASGAQILTTLEEKTFHRESEISTEAKNLQDMISSWLLHSNFVLGFYGISAQAHVPFTSAYNINNRLTFNDFIVYRNLEGGHELKRVVQTGGADATFEMPTYLLPHHEHLLPPIPSRESEEHQRAASSHAQGKPRDVQAHNSLGHTHKDEANMKIALHISLPFLIDHELLEVITALLKASRIAEMEKPPSGFEDEMHGVKDLSKAISSSLKGNLRKSTFDTVVKNDKWIASLVDKITKQLETARGDVGYSFFVPIPLKPYRDNVYHQSKLLA